MAEVTFDGVSKIYPDGTRAVDSFDLEVLDGEFMVLVGPSGCNKTTALRMVAGLEEISEGELGIGDRVVNQLAPREDIAMVFQSYALYPHLTVYDNSLSASGSARRRRTRSKSGCGGAHPRARAVPRSQAAGARRGSGSELRWAERSCAIRTRS